MSSLTLKPIDPDHPPDGLYPQSQVHGIVIYWRVAPSRPVKRRRRQQLQLPLSDWQEQQVHFSEVSPSGADEPPCDAEEQARFVRLAYVLAACKHPIPADAEIYYQVWW
jgi:hypothetical protein